MGPGSNPGQGCTVLTNINRLGVGGIRRGTSNFSESNVESRKLIVLVLEMLN